MNIKRGFTLVELLVVISILGVLATIGLMTFNSAQAKGRDAQRKSDLKQISSALELYYNDYGAYPASSGANTGQIIGCPTTTGTVCGWGSGQFTDDKTIYMRQMPKDPMSNQSYYYRGVTVNGVENQGFQLYAKLENTQDATSCIGGDCGVHEDLPEGVVCSSGVVTASDCNFAVTSPNVAPTDDAVGITP
jgi:type II secretion system protein G